MIQFKSAKHTVKENDVVEIWLDNQFVGALYPHGETGVKILSKFLHREVLADFRTRAISDRDALEQRRVELKRYMELYTNCFQCGAPLSASADAVDPVTGEVSLLSSVTEHKENCPVGKLLGVDSTRRRDGEKA